jgi:hypothetical protein
LEAVKCLCFFSLELHQPWGGGGGEGDRTFIGISAQLIEGYFFVHKSWRDKKEEFKGYVYLFFEGYVVIHF